MPAYCPLCASDEGTSEERADDGRRFATCHGSFHGAEPYVWEISDPHDRRSYRGDGLGAELGIWDKLLNCFTEGEDFQPYGVVEDRFIERFPDETRELLVRYGHRWRFPDHPATRFSMSVYLAGRLRELASEGHLALKWGPAEGAWAYNEIISCWKLAGATSG